MIVIADSTPLRYLVEIEYADILPKLFGHVLIPDAVLRELSAPRTPQIVRAWIAAPPSWLEVRVAPAVETSLTYLGQGEREAISLAQEIHPEWLIIDDAQGRREAARRHIPTLGTLRVLDEAAARRLIDVKQVLERLKSTTFYISPDLAEWLLIRDSDRKRQP